MADWRSGQNQVRGVWGSASVDLVVRLKEGRENFTIITIGSGTCWGSSEGCARSVNAERMGRGGGIIAR